MEYAYLTFTEAAVLFKTQLYLQSKGKDCLETFFTLLASYMKVRREQKQVYNNNNNNDSDEEDDDIALEEAKAADPIRHMEEACKLGYLHVVRYMFQNGHFGDRASCVEVAAQHGRLSVLSFLIQHGYPITKRAVDLAAYNGQSLVLIFLRQVSFLSHKHFTSQTANFAAASGCVDALCYLAKVLKIQPTPRAVTWAVANQHHDVLVCLLYEYNVKPTFEAMRFAVYKNDKRCIQTLYLHSPFLYLQMLDWLEDSNEVELKKRMNILVHCSRFGGALGANGEQNRCAP